MICRIIKVKGVVLALIFKIKMPNGIVRTMRYNKDTPIGDRIKLIQEHVIDYWENYFHDYWLKESKNINISINQTKDILDRCATFILLADMRKNDILSSYSINSINENEVQSFAPNWEDDENFDLSPNHDEQQKILFTHTEIKKDGKKVVKQQKKWKKSKTRKLHKLYTIPELRTYRLKPVVDENKKPVKNIFGQAIFDAEYVTIGGQKGLIDRSKPYISEWCIVDTENKFKFNNTKFQIDESVKQYEVSTDNKCLMDSVLCIHVDGKTHFYDANVDQIDNNLIKQV